MLNADMKKPRDGGALSELLAEQPAVEPTQRLK